MKNEDAVREMKRLVGLMNEIEKCIVRLDDMDVRVLDYHRGAIQLLYGIDDVADAEMDDNGYYTAYLCGTRVFEV